MKTYREVGLDQITDASVLKWEKEGFILKWNSDTIELQYEIKDNQYDLH